MFERIKKLLRKQEDETLPKTREEAIEVLRREYPKDGTKVHLKVYHTGFFCELCGALLVSQTHSFPTIDSRDEFNRLPKDLRCS